MAIDGSTLLASLERNLRELGIDPVRQTEAFGQTDALRQRRAGKTFSLRDHVRALILAQLSNQRPWAPIERRMDEIVRLFSDFDPDTLAAADPADLTARIRALSCGNRQIAHQMKALAPNIATLRRIEAAHGSIDAFITGNAPYAIAERLANPGSYKLKHIGITLALEYLRNVGIDAAKPDLHVCRILSAARLGVCSARPTPREASDAVAKLASEAGCSATYLDNLLWLHCADGYAQVCTASPRCSRCALSSHCNYPVRATS